VRHRSPYSLPFRARESKRRQSGGVPIDLRDLLAQVDADIAMVGHRQSSIVAPNLRTPISLQVDQ